jgi:hypothetical protein
VRWVQLRGSVVRVVSAGGEVIDEPVDDVWYW